MNNERLRIEFKVGLDKVDSSAYPELYDEQIDIFLDDAIDEFVSEARKGFELNQQITDEVKSLVKSSVVYPSREDDEYLFPYPSDYLYLLRVRPQISINNTTYESSAHYCQQDDIEVVLDDPFNKPTPNRVPYIHEAIGLRFFANESFGVNLIRLTFMRKPAKISLGQEIDLDEKVHKSIVKRAIAIALENIESIRSRK